MRENPHFAPTIIFDFPGQYWRVHILSPIILLSTIHRPSSPHLIQSHLHTYFHFLRQTQKSKPQRQEEERRNQIAPMATASASSLSPILAATTTATRTRTTTTQKVNYIAGLNSFGGLKANNRVISLGQAMSTEQSFAKVVSSLRDPSREGNKGGALSAKCNAAGEIFKIAAIMNGLVLVGVAIGFVLLRIEASVEEAAEWSSQWKKRKWWFGVYTLMFV